MPKWPDDDVILFDGVCIFCSRWVRFVAKRDPAKRFRFTPIQSDYGARLARTFGIDPADPDTNAVVHGGAVFMKSDAALTVLSQLPGAGAGCARCSLCPSRYGTRSTISSRATDTASSASMIRASYRMPTCGRG
ncbi:putative DCC family thiol-disulfide oxidoreductase YuxK [Bradyrhizobium sp. GM2.4]